MGVGNGYFRERTPVMAALSLAFFLSGTSALVYQTAWQRMLGIFGGSDSITAALVVGAFLLGLGLGSLWASLAVDRATPRQALLLFAACEAGIGAFGYASPDFFNTVLLTWLAPWADNRALVFTAAFSGMIGPTVLMGLSLPLLARAVVQTVETSARQIGNLYGVNTLGAGLGALAAGWLVIGTIGFEAAIYGAALLNFLVAAVAAAVALRFPEPERELRNSTGPTGGLRDVPWRIWEWGMLVFLSGFLIIALEIVWFRIIGVVLQGNTYTFPLVLGVFLMADAAGIFIAVRIVDRIASPRRLFLWLQGVTALYALVSLLALYGAYHSRAFGQMFMHMGSLEFAAGKQALVWGLTLFLVALPALLLGMSFPIVQRAVQEDPRVVGQRVGLVQLFNIVGNAAGSLVTGLLLLHWFGTVGTLMLIAALAVGLMGLLAWESRGQGGTWRPAAMIAVMAMAMLGFPAGQTFWSRLHGVLPGEDGMVAEDRTGLAYLTLWGERGQLFVFGHFQSSLPFAPYHATLGAIGPLLHPDPKAVLVIGAGMGSTPYFAGINPLTQRIRVVELVGPVYELQRRYVARGHDLGVKSHNADPRYTFLLGDGRHELARNADRYDVIEADAIFPRTANSGLLYSREFFAMVRQRLNPGGIAVQWAPTPRIEATFASVFPHVALVAPLNVLLGSDQPIALDAGGLRNHLEGPAMRARLEAAQVDRAELAKWAGGKITRWNPASPHPSTDTNSDLFPKDEYYLNTRKIHLWR